MRSVFRTTWPYLSRYKRGLALGLGALILKDGAGALVPLAIKAGIDSLTQGKAITHLFWFALALLACAAVKGIFQYHMRVILVGISRDVEFDLRNDLYAKLVTLDASFFARYRTGDLMARSTNDLNAVRMMMGPALMYWAETSLTFVLALIIMFSVDWQLTLWALSPAPVVSFVVIFFGRRIHHLFQRIQSLFSDISSRVQENFIGVRVLRAYTQEPQELAHFEKLNREFIAENVELARLSAAFMPLLQALIGLTFLIVLWVGGRRLLAGELSLGSFVMFNTFMGMLVWPMIAFGWVVNLMERGRASLERLQEVLHESPRIQAPEAPLTPPLQPSALELRNVTMGWNDRYALSGINLTIHAGQTIAIVGRTGSGKSTLVHLLARLYDPLQGSVEWNGHDLRAYAPADVRRRMGFVPQETYLFSATLAENIAFGDDGPGRALDAPLPPEMQARVAAAAEMAGLETDVTTFPNGLGTVVGERGLTLSGGQKQRTAIARAVFRDPEVLILDDALSAVDTITEEKILTRLRSFMRGRTTILISHRVSTVRNADCIYVLDEGRIVEQGNHDSLLASGGYYAELHQKQLLEEELEAL